MKPDGLPDALDRKILAALSADARISMTELARRVHLSRPAVQARIARLEDNGAIRGYHADIHMPGDEDGQRALLMARIGVRPCAPALDYLMGQPEVRQVWSIAGPQDATIEVITRDAAALSELTDRLAASPYRIEAEARPVLAAFGKPSRTGPGAG
ncbi:Lrp/AsnC family transcriptional regulator [Acidimangrovimonas pyrenivorans]|uniref:Lrp/AsnC family transcriptional regulator n=1 Tax=Acidimangrovimonas pyrenivorans TaxID=2030798 RepID=A0ABV7ADV4_9RHOB